MKIKVEIEEGPFEIRSIEYKYNLRWRGEINGVPYGSSGVTDDPMKELKEQINTIEKLWQTKHKKTKH